MFFHAGCSGRRTANSSTYLQLAASALAAADIVFECTRSPRWLSGGGARRGPHQLISSAGGRITGVTQKGVSRGSRSRTSRSTETSRMHKNGVMRGHSDIIWAWCGTVLVVGPANPGKGITHMDTDDDNVARTPGGWQTGILHSQQYLPSGVRWRTKQDRNLADCHMYQEAEAMTRRRMVHAS